MARYVGKVGAMYSDEEAQVLGAVIEELGGNTVTPEQLVDAARSKRSPIHKMWNWDVDEAAEAHWLHQARTHINHLEVEVVIDGKKTRTKAFHSVTIVEDDETERVYMNFKAVVRNESASAQVIGNAMKQLEGWQSRYSQYQEMFGGVFQEIKKAKRRVGRRQKVK